MNPEFSVELIKNMMFQAVTDIAVGEKASWVDLEWLRGGGGGKANTLYLVVPLDDYERLAPVLGGFLSDLKAQAYEWDVAGRRFPATLLMLIDEAATASAASVVARRRPSRQALCSMSSSSGSTSPTTPTA